MLQATKENTGERFSVTSKSPLPPVHQALRLPLTEFLCRHCSFPHRSRGNSSRYCFGYCASGPSLCRKAPSKSHWKKNVTLFGLTVWSFSPSWRKERVVSWSLHVLGREGRDMKMLGSFSPFYSVLTGMVQITCRVRPTALSLQ